MHSPAHKYFILTFFYGTHTTILVSPFLFRKGVFFVLVPESK